MNPLKLFGMALASTAANETKFPIARVQEALEAWRASEDAREQREESVLAAYQENHLGPRNQRILAYESYVAQRHPLYDAVVRAPHGTGERTDAIRRMLGVPVPPELQTVGVLRPVEVYTRYP